jgi:hypothetical protein
MATTAVSVTSADAQMSDVRHRGGRASDQKAMPKTPKVDEKAYNAALKTIPDSKDKFDPWGSLGVSPVAKKPK